MDERVVKILQLLKRKEDSLRKIKTADALNEAEAAAEKIAELCLRYKVDMSTVELQEYEDANPIERELYTYDPTDKYRSANRVAWEVTLGNAVARAHQCRLLVGRGYLVFVGRTEDRSLAMTMFRILRLGITNSVDRWYHDARRRGLSTKGFITSYMVSATDRIAQRYRSMETRVVTETNSTALVTRMDRDLEEAVLAISGGRTSTTRPKLSNGWNGEGSKRGREYGNSVSLNPNALDSSGQSARALNPG